jgi:hypothetical protein
MQVLRRHPDIITERPTRRVAGSRSLEPRTTTARQAAAYLGLATGTTDVKLKIPASASAGASKLKLTLKDSAGNTKSYARTVHVHALK